MLVKGLGFVCCSWHTETGHRNTFCQCMVQNMIYALFLYLHVCSRWSLQNTITLTNSGDVWSYTRYFPWTYSPWTRLTYLHLYFMYVLRVFLTSWCIIGGMCVSVCVWVCFAWEVGVCFVLRFLHELFLTYLHEMNSRWLLEKCGWIFINLAVTSMCISCNWPFPYESSEKCFVNPLMSS